MWAKPDFAKEMEKLHGAQPGALPPPAGAAAASTGAGANAVAILPANAAAFLAAGSGVLAAVVSFGGFGGAAASVVAGAFPTVIYLLLSVHVFELVTGMPGGLSGLLSQSALGAALTAGRTVAAASRSLCVLVFTFLAALVLLTKLDEVTQAAAAALAGSDSSRGGAVAGVAVRAALAVGVLALLALACALPSFAAQRARRRAAVQRFTQLALLMLRHEWHMADWAGGQRTTFESTEATGSLPRAELRCRVVRELARAEPGLFGADGAAAAAYDAEVEPALLRLPTVRQLDGDGDLLEWTGAPKKALQPKLTLEASRQQRLEVARVRRALTTPAAGGGRDVSPENE